MGGLRGEDCFYVESLPFKFTHSTIGHRQEPVNTRMEVRDPIDENEDRLFASSEAMDDGPCSKIYVADTTLILISPMKISVEILGQNSDGTLGF